MWLYAEGSRKYLDNTEMEGNIRVIKCFSSNYFVFLQI